MLWLAIIAISTLSSLYSLCLKLVQRDYLRRQPDFFFFSIVLNCFQLVCLVLLPPYRVLSFSWPSIYYGAAIGVLILAGYLFTVRAMSTGPLALTNSIISISIFVPIIFGLFFWGETLSWFDLVGMLLFLFSMLIISRSTYYVKDQIKKIELKWIIYVVLTVVSTGLTMSISKKFALIRPAESKEYLFSYMVANIILSVIVYFYLRRRSGDQTAARLKPGIRFMILGALAGAVMAATNVLFMNYVGTISSVFFFPATRVISILLMLLFSSWIFKERMQKKAFLGFLLSALAILLVSFDI